MEETTAATSGTDQRGPCPWEIFDAEWYAATHMRERSPLEPADPAAHYASIGVASGFGPNRYFDEAFYLKRYPAVRGLVARGEFASGFAHYRALGYRDLEPHWLFSEVYYRARRPDLTEDGLARFGLRNGYHHFIVAGQNESASGSAFFDAEIIDVAPDDRHQPYSALLEGRVPADARLSRYFDPDWYLAMYDEVADLVADGFYTSALHHFLVNPTPEHFNPGPDFDEAFYRAENAELADAIARGQLRSGAIHFFEHGRIEGRRPSPWFDPAIYMTNRRVAADIKAGLAPTAFDHFLRFGRAQGLPATPPAHIGDVPECAGKTVFVRMARLAGQQHIAFSPVAEPDITVIIVAFNQFDLTMQSLMSLSGSTGTSFEVILIDNASFDETRRIEKHVSGLRILRNSENTGFLHAVNQGLQHAGGRHVLLLNNDVTLLPTALALACARLDAHGDVGAVGGKIVRTHGLLQEAGSLVFSNGSGLGYGRGLDPTAPEFNFVRDVDYCSGVFLMIRGRVMRELGGLDPAYAPAYYEETDLCARIWGAGLRVVYDPAIVIHHLEFGSSRNPDAPRALMRRNREILLTRQRDWLSTKCLPDLALAVHARSAVRRTRVLFIEDTVPYHHIGSGFGRAADIVQSLVELDCDVTIFPMNPMIDRPADLRQGFAETVEVLWDRDLTRAPALFAERETFYDVVWISRAHNLQRLAAVLGGKWGPLRHARVILDTEALGANRDAARAMLDGQRFDLKKALRREMRETHLARDVVAVSPDEADQLRAMGLTRVHLLGHALRPSPTPRSFEQRRNFLAVGALYGVRTPNFDGLRWFIDHVWPIVHPALPEARLLIAGFAVPDLDVAALLTGPGIEHLGFVENVGRLYDEARVFVAPTRFAAGIPRKVHDAAASGLPIVATTVLERQLGWEPDAVLVADPASPVAFADALIRLYSQQPLWEATREKALHEVTTICAPDQFTRKVGEIIGLPARVRVG